MSACVRISNYFAAKKGLAIALEVTRYELSSEQINRISNFIDILNESEKSLNISYETLKDLNKCVDIFKNSKSIHWMREDFVYEILQFEDIENTNI